MGASTWARVPHEIGDPISLEMSSEMPCMSLRIDSATLARTAARSAGAMRGHGPWSKASRAAATARSTSATWASGTRPTSSSVVGETTSKAEEEDGSTHSPPMNRRSYDFTGPPLSETGRRRLVLRVRSKRGRTIRAGCTGEMVARVRAGRPPGAIPGYAPIAIFTPPGHRSVLQRPETPRNDPCSPHWTTTRSIRSPSPCDSWGPPIAISTTATTSTSMAPEACTGRGTSCSPSSGSGSIRT